MRQTKMIATKNHFILMAASNKIGTELWAGYAQGQNVRSVNAIGFVSRGEVSTFNANTANASWSKYDDGASPLMTVRPNFGTFGIAAKSESVTFGCIIPKEFHVTEQFSHLNLANQEEIEKIEDTNNETVYVYQQCKYDETRDLDTFDIIPKNEEIANTGISDSEITIEIEEV
jgi:hypothetical protein